MDKTLTNYFEQADKIHDEVIKTALLIKPTKLHEYMMLLKKNIRLIQGVAKHMADVSNACNTILIRKNIKAKNIDTYPTEHDHVAIRDMKSFEVVQNINEIPISKLYYVKQLKQYAININGMIIKGDLANINNGNHSQLCKKGIKCKNIINCKYWHDPEDFIKLKIPIPQIKRNLKPSSWLYMSKPNNRYGRHVGNAETLNNDIALLKKTNYKNEVSNREYQLIHDLIIYITLQKNNLIPKYVI